LAGSDNSVSYSTAIALSMLDRLLRVECFAVTTD